MGRQIDWDRFVKSTWKSYMSFLMKKDIPITDAEDILQNVYMGMSKASYEVKPGNTLESTYRYIGYTGIHRLAMNYKRNKKTLYKKAGMIFSLDVALQEEFDHDNGAHVFAPESFRDYQPDPSENIIWTHIKNNLTDRQFSILTAYAAGCSYQEVANIHGIALGTTKSFLSRARKKIRSLDLDI